MSSSSFFPLVITTLDTPDSFKTFVTPRIEAGADAFLPKPLQIQDLLRSLNRHAGLEALYEMGSRPDPRQAWSAKQPLPPRIRLENLLATTQRGDIKAIHEQVNQFQELDKRFAEFTMQLNFFANRFQLIKMREFLKRTLTESEKI